VGKDLWNVSESAKAWVTYGRPIPDGGWSSKGEVTGSDQMLA
jgi:hypothetical protein